jgi:HEAT repeat protein
MLAMRVALFFVVASLCLVSGVQAPASPPEDASADEQTLTAAGLSTDGQALLEFFRSRTRLEPDREHLLALTQQLGDKAAEARARAAAELVARGPVAIPALRHAINDLSDPQIAARARQCLQMIEGASGAAIPAAAARVLASRKPAGAAEALLAYLPFADDQAVADTVSQAIAALAFAEGKPDPALVSALQDPVPVRRAVAGEALCRKDQPEQWPAVRKLLTDPKPTVRLRAALALANQQDVASIPVLIDLLAELTPEQRRQAEEVLQNLAGEWAPIVNLAGDDDVSRRIRRDAWMGWWRNTEGPALFAEFRKRTLTPEGQAKIETLVQNLGHDVFATREQAVTELAAYGNLAAPFLREATRGTDLERTRRAEACLKLIARNETIGLPMAAPRLLALRKPAGAVEVLLDYLPYAESEAMAGEVHRALAALALRDGTPDPALVRALEDKLPARRAAAGEALAQAGEPNIRGAVRKLLQDADAAVRLQVALALVAARDKDAVPALIDALADLPPEQSTQAQDTLLLLASDKAPAVTLGGDLAARRQARDAWAAWWREHATSVDLAKVQAGEHYLGYTLLVEVDGGGNGRVQELDRSGKQRWIIEQLQYPVDAWVLAGNRVLIAEYNGMKVTERDLKGKIMWEKTGLRGRTTNVQRLPTGNTFISTDTEVIEVDRTGKEVFTKSFAGRLNLIAGYKARNGEIVVLTAQGTCMRMTAAGNEIKTFAANRDGAWTSGLDLVPDGRILIAQPNRNRVQIFNRDGKMVWDAAATGVVTASWLSNGHVLVASYNNQSAVELDRNGKTVWQHKSTHHVFRARRR